MDRCLKLLYADMDLLENLSQFHFVNVLLGKKAKPYHYILYLILAEAGVFVFQESGEDRFFILALLFSAGAVFFKAGIRLSLLSAAIAFEVMQLSYGILNSLSGLIFKRYFEINPAAIALGIMLLGRMLSLCLALLCYFAICRFLAYDKMENSQYILMLLTPLMMIFLASEYISFQIYGDTIIVNEQGDFGELNHLHLLFIQLFGLFSVFCILYAFKKMSLNYTLSTKLRLLQQEANYQQNYIEEVKARYEKTKAFRHDIKNHITVIKGLLEKENREEALTYMENLEGIAQEMSFPCSCNNPVVDILVGNKLGLAQAYGIRVSCSLAVPGSCPVRDMDLCIILSNALDNAVNACRNMSGDAEKYICLTGRIQGEFFLIEAENSYNGTPGGQEYGIGLTNIKATAEKYNGTMSINYYEKFARLSVLLVILHPLNCI